MMIATPIQLDKPNLPFVNPVSSCENTGEKAFADQQQAKNIALACLARRDHSRLELYQKLVARGVRGTIIDEILDDLQAGGYQSDERFTETFIRTRIRAGDGPFKIKIALRGKGICDSLVLAVIDKLDIDWFERVKAIKEKHFGGAATDDIRQLAKQVRYLKNRGFYQDHIDAVIDYSH